MYHEIALKLYISIIQRRALSFHLTFCTDSLDPVTDTIEEMAFKRKRGDHGQSSFINCIALQCSLSISGLSSSYYGKTRFNFLLLSLHGF